MPELRHSAPPSSPRGLGLEVVPVTAGFTWDSTYMDRVIRSDAGSDITIVLPRDAQVGSRSRLYQAGAGAVILSPAAGATLRSSGGQAGTRGLYDSAEFYVVKAGEWVLGSANGASPAGVVSAELFGMIGDGIKKTDGVVSGTSLISAGSAFTSADIGKTIQIFNAGAGGNTAFTTTIASVANATHLTLNSEVTTNIASGAVFDYGTDNTTAFQAAINFAATVGKNCKIQFGNGYFFHGSVKLPAFNSSSLGWDVVEFEGAVHPSMTYGTAGSPALPNSGTILKNYLTSSTSGIAVDTGGGFSNYTVVFRNINGRTCPNPASTWLDASWAQQLVMENCSIDTGLYSLSAVQPTQSSGYGIKTPINTNGALTYLRNVGISGMYVALQANEHFNGDEINLNGNLVGAELQAADHSIRFGRLMTQNCVTGIKVTGDCRFVVEEHDIEHAPSGWQQTTYDIDDASNHGYGEVKWSVVLGNVGQDATYTKNGGANIRTSRIGHPLMGSATYDPGSLGDGVGATTTVTVTGAALGDFAQATFSLDLQGITLTAWVSGADTVSVRFQNESGGTLDLASGTLRAKVAKL